MGNSINLILSTPGGFLKAKPLTAQDILAKGHSVSPKDRLLGVMQRLTQRERETTV